HARVQGPQAERLETGCRRRRRGAGFRLTGAGDRSTIVVTGVAGARGVPVRRDAPVLRRGGRGGGPRPRAPPPGGRRPGGGPPAAGVHGRGAGRLTWPVIVRGGP